MKLTIGSRGSQLALWQANWVQAQLQKIHPKLDIQIQIIKTTGDKILDSPLSKIGDKGLFTREIEHALLERQIDLAVHSLKDLPTELPEGLTIGAITKREDVRDVFIKHPAKSYSLFEELPQGATVATGSLRRKCQLMSIRPDLNIIDLRGNLNTRFSKLDASDWDGMLLARAGVIRLGWQNRITDTLSVETMLPAVGQGALGIEIRENAKEVRKLIEPLRSEATTYATLAERSLLRFLEGGCQIPIGAYGRIEKNQLLLDALVGSLDGKTIVRGKVRGVPSDAEELGTQLGRTLYKGGAKEILENIRSRKVEEIPGV